MVVATRVVLAWRGGARDTLSESGPAGMFTVPGKPALGPGQGDQQIREMMRHVAVPGISKDQ